MAPDNRLKLEARKNEEKTSKTKPKRSREPKGQTELHLKSFSASGRTRASSIGMFFESS